MPRATAVNKQEALETLLVTFRTDIGLRQVDLAERLGKPQSFVSKYESGERRLDIIELHAVCEALGISLIDFAERFLKAIK